MIPQDTIDKILSAAKIEDVIAEYVGLKKRGVNYVGCCPFHSEKTASLVVSPTKAMYHCFGCGKGGNAIGFVKDHETVSYPDAIKIVAQKYHIPVDYTESSEDTAEFKHRESLKSVLKWSANYYNTFSGIKAAADYFDKRKISLEIIEEYNLGYSSPGWNTMEKAAAENGYSKDVLLGAGLIKKGDRNTYDFFRNRIMFPFHDVSGNCIGFTGRNIAEEVFPEERKIAKYLNSEQTELFNKGKIIYGLFQAKRQIVSLDRAYLVEGNIDVLRFVMMAIKNTVAGSGTAFTPDQVRLLKRFTENVVIVYDGDPAGIKASFKNFDILLENGMNVRAVMLPKGEDPDSFGLKKTPEKLQDYLDKHEKDFITLKYELLKEGVDDPAQIACIVKEILQTIALIPDDITRHFYEIKCIEKFKFTEKEVKQFFKTLHKRVPDKVDETRNGWIGLDFALDAIKEKDECIITLNQKSLIDGICGSNTGTVEENTICHSGKIEQLHLQELNKISENILFTDKTTILDIKNDSKIIQLGKALFKSRFNISVLVEDGENTEKYSFMDRFVILSKEYIEAEFGDDLIKRNCLEKTAELLSYADNTKISVSTSWTAKQFGIKESAFNNILKPFLEKRKTKVLMATSSIVSEGETLQFDPEHLPDYVDETKFRRYGFFPAQNSKGLKVAYVFRTDMNGLITVGNFYMEPLFHVYHDDPNKNKRIVQINNGEQNRQFYMELPSDSMVDFNLFKKYMWRKGGNVFSKGKPIHFEMILSSVANQFPTAYELNVFGQQHENFWAFSNAIFSDGEMKYTDEYGLADHKGTLYYSPAFSKIYKDRRKEDDSFEQDRHFVFKENKDTDFAKWASLMDVVYKANDNGKWATIMAILSAFRSVIYPIDRLFTSLFFTGPTQSGKTQIAISIRSLFMAPEATLFNLNSGTDAAFFSVLERFRDVPIIFEEYNDYQISDIKFQGLKAAVYDGEGKTKRKDATSKDLDVSKINGIPILLGQERPERDDGALGNRCVLKQVPLKSDWLEEEVSLFQDLKKREKNGLSNILIEILRIRPLIVEYFSKQQRLTFKELKAAFREKGITIENRITNTVSLFTTMVKILENYAPHLKLPFTYAEFLQLAKEQIIEQSEAIISTNRLSGFFESLEILMIREKILFGRDFKIEQSEKTITIMLNSKETYDKDIPNETKLLFLRINNIHSHYQDLKRNEALKIGNLMTYIKDHPAYIGHVKSTRFDWVEVKDMQDPQKDYVQKKSIKASSNTSAVVFDYNILKESLNIDLEKFNASPEDDIDKEPKEEPKEGEGYPF